MYVYTLLNTVKILYINWWGCEKCVSIYVIKVHRAKSVHIVEETPLDIIKTQQWFYQRDRQGREQSKDGTEQAVNYS